MPKITFKNTGETFDVPVGTSILECAIDHNIPLNHDCGGNCACTTCQLWVEDGMKNLSAMSEDERGLLEANDKLDAKARLGCQSRIQNGNVVVRYPEI
jgi:2Fe-2S ferredoxin